MKIVGGVERPTSGIIRVGGRDHDSLDVGSATRAGIAFVHQELNLFDNLTVGANVLIGGSDTRRPAAARRPSGGGAPRRADPGTARRRLRTRHGAGGPLLAERQLVEIAKALSLEARILILDEPTSSLTVAETARLLDRIRDLKAEGVSVVFITHRLAELEAGGGPRRRAARRPGRRRARRRGDRPRGDDPPDDRPRPALALPAAGGAAGRAGTENGWPRRPPIPASR